MKPGLDDEEDGPSFLNSPVCSKFTNSNWAETGPVVEPSHPEPGLLATRLLKTIS